MKKLFLCLVALFVLGNFIPALANDYEITNYNVAIKVGQNDVLDILERISTNFNVPKLGIS